VAAGGLVELVERGEATSPAVHARVDAALEPLREAAVDVVALGCTHYAFLKEAVRRSLGPDVTVLEPGEAVARQVARVLAARGLAAPAQRAGSVTYTSSAGDAQLLRTIALLRGEGVATG